MEGVIEDVTKASGTDDKVVEQKALIKISDIDEWLTKKEIGDEILQNAILKSDLVNIISLRHFDQTVERTLLDVTLQSGGKRPRGLPYRLG